MIKIIIPQINQTTLIPYNTKQIYQLINNIQSYPQFLPNYTKNQILKSTPKQITTTINISKTKINKTFTTHNQLTNNQNILINLINKPFKKLINK